MVQGCLSLELVIFGVIGLRRGVVEGSRLFEFGADIYGFNRSKELR